MEFLKEAFAAFHKDTRGQVGFDLIPVAIGVSVLIVIVFAVVVPVTNTMLYPANANTTVNLSGAENTLANQTKLMIILGLVFVPLAGIAAAYFLKRS